MAIPMNHIRIYLCTGSERCGGGWPRLEINPRVPEKRQGQGIWNSGFRRRGRGKFLPEVQFNSEIAALTPAEIKFEPVVFVIDEGQINNPAPGDGKIPAAVRVPDQGGINPITHRFFVRHADHIIA